MRQTEFLIGDRCLFSFSGDRDVPVEVVGDYAPNENCVWAAPEDVHKRIPYAHEKTICGRYAFATNIEHLLLIERPGNDGDDSIDISSLL